MSGITSNKRLLKQCTHCKQKYSIDDFHKNRNMVDGLARWCKNCCKKQQKSYRENNKNKISKKGKKRYQNNKKRISKKRKKHRKENKLIYKLRHRKWSLKNKYGITLKEYNKILKNQGYCCAICGKHKDNFDRALAVDHDHKIKRETGRVLIRGLLCIRCNHYIMGQLRDNKEIFKGVIAYLTKTLKELGGIK